MEIGIGLPNAVPGTSGRQLTDWARAAEEAGFSTLGTIDRTVYPNYEPLTALDRTTSPPGPRSFAPPGRRRAATASRVRWRSPTSRSALTVSVMPTST